MEQLDHLITRKIRSTYGRRLVSPIIYIIFLIIVWFYTPLQAVARPVHISDEANIEALADGGSQYVSVTLTDLNFTGYTQSRMGFVTGYYYYTVRTDGCYLVILSPRTCQEGLSSIDRVTIHACIRRMPESYSALASRLSEDLDWTTTGFYDTVNDCLISEPGFGRVGSTILLAVYYITGAYALLSMILFAAYALFPVLSPASRQLGLYGKRKELLAQAEEELATLPQLATEDMYITEHFFIAFANKAVTIIPIDQIVWIYKYSTLHKLLWYHFSISYTLHITAKKHLYIQFPKNMKSDIDGIIDYLSEANHDILVGFNEKNRKAVQAMPGVTRFADGLIAFLKQKI
jgi:hypothetical protein